MCARCGAGLITRGAAARGMHLTIPCGPQAVSLSSWPTMAGSRGGHGVIQRGLEWVIYNGAGLMSGAPRPTSVGDAIRAAAPRPVLIIAGGGVADEPVAARWFRAASLSTVQVWIVPRALYTGCLATQPQEWEPG
jgi:hypothetical protein